MNDSRRSTVLTSPLVVRAVAVGVVLVGAYWCWVWWRTPVRTFHRHEGGAHGGTVVAVGPAHFHVEALVAEGGTIRLYMLGHDQSRVVTVPTQKLTAYVRPPEATESTPVVLEAKSQPDDPQGETSMFEGQLPLELVGSPLAAVVPSITIDKARYRFSFTTQDSHAAQMPRKVTNEAERELYLKPAGKFTDADIRANGSMTASQKYRGFKSVHDMHPAAGDTICPITHTKANPQCTWVVNGKQYMFCCPPCIDEFVKLAKEHPEQIQEPHDYAQK